MRCSLWGRRESDTTERLNNNMWMCYNLRIHLSPERHPGCPQFWQLGIKSCRFLHQYKFSVYAILK